MIGLLGTTCGIIISIDCFDVPTANRKASSGNASEVVYFNAQNSEVVFTIICAERT